MRKKRLLLCMILAAMLALSACGEKKETITGAMIEAAKEDALAGGRSNRELTRAEMIGQYKAQAQYMYEGRRAAERSDEELPVFLMPEDAKGREQPYWVYPETEMTEEQLLAMMDINYGSVSPEMYLPKENQLSYEDAKARVTELLTEYAITDAEINQVYLMYYSHQGLPLVSELEDYWNAMISCKSGYDYSMKFRADNGEMLMWLCRLPGYYDAEQMPELLEEKDWIVNEYTPEELEAAAEAYMKKIGMADRVLSYRADSTAKPGNPEEPPRYRVCMQIKGQEDAGSKDIYLDAKDLSVRGIQWGNIW